VSRQTELSFEHRTNRFKQERRSTTRRSSLTFGESGNLGIDYRAMELIGMSHMIVESYSQLTRNHSINTTTGRTLNILIQHKEDLHHIPIGTGISADTLIFEAVKFITLHAHT
jgi:hypothetical protein